ncbi:MAG: hypothetical protein WA708_09405 [Acidobacteriaceae bacterium]
MASCAVALAVASVCSANAQSPSAQQLAQQVINNELAANRNDHTHWMYRDADKTPSKDIVKLVVETQQATVSKTIELNGRPLTPQQQTQDHAKMENIVNDPSVRAKQKKSSSHDDAQAVAMMQMLPNAFLWSYAGEWNGDVTLHFKPNPAFQPPTYASRVFAAMAGDMVIDAKQKRLKMLTGTLIQPVEFGWGLLGKLEQGGTFRVVRSEVAPGDWEITQTHVHIQGHALIFKSISEQEDETTSNYKPTPPSLTLSQAVQMLQDGTVAKEIGVASEN